jgi:hypothetical protein
MNAKKSASFMLAFLDVFYPSDKVLNYATTDVMGDFKLI